MTGLNDGGRRVQAGSCRRLVVVVAVVAVDGVTARGLLGFGMKRCYDGSVAIKTFRVLFSPIDCHFFYYNSFRYALVS